MDELKSVLLETLCEFHEFCETHNLDYFIIGGTLLGAVRNQGFIPWDDDIDVAMPRADYDKLLKLHSHFKDPIKFKSIRNIKNFRFPYIKLTNEKIMLEEAAYNPFISGAWIDIFPLDYTYENPKLQSLHFSSTRILRIILNLKYELADIEQISGYGRIIAPSLQKVSKGIPRDLLTKLFKLNETIPKKILYKKLYYANLYGYWGSKEIAPIKVFEPKKLYKFEGKMFWGPFDSHYWLKRVYGDYMKLPSIENRKTNHNIKILS